MVISPLTARHKPTSTPPPSLPPRFDAVDVLRGFETVEQCSLDYRPEKGASIDPHVDDCWIWGERIPTVNLLSHSVLTLTLYRGRPDR